MSVENGTDDLLCSPSDLDFPSLTRAAATYRPLTQFDLAKGELKQYKQQYGDMYFLRLAKLKPAVEAVAEAAWDGYELAGETVSRVDRVLDVRQGELCWVAGTIYLDMPLKPNILDDISKDHWISAPPPRGKYVSPDGHDKVMLEDESGRLRLIGASLEREMLVTGCIVAVMGTENANGDFEVLDIKIPDLPAQTARWEMDGQSTSAAQAQSEGKGSSGKVAIVSGLAITGDRGDSLSLDLLQEWLLGEFASPSVQRQAAQITRLIIAGNSLAEAQPMPASEDVPALAPGAKKAASSKKYGYDASTYNPAPPQQLDLLLSSLLPSIPITLIPGASDPANVSLPQQPLHPALFPHSRAYAAAPPTTPTAPPKLQPSNTKALPTFARTDPGSFHPATNPSIFTLAGHLFLGTGGQPTADMAKYLAPTPPALALLEATLRWRLLAPTAPDTLWCYPYQADDPFVLVDGACPHVYFAGGQDAFATRVVEGAAGQRVRVVAVPRFAETGEVVLVDLDSLDVEVVRFAVGGGGSIDAGGA